MDKRENPAGRRGLQGKNQSGRDAETIAELIARVNTATLQNLLPLLENLFPAGKLQGQEYLVGDLAGNPGRSLSINTASGVWKDFSTDEGGRDPVSLYAAALRLKQGEAARRLAEVLRLDTSPRPAAGGRVVDFNAVPSAKPRPSRRVVAGYDYHDAAGEVVFQVTRWEPKSFTQRKPDGRGGWINNMQGVALVPFNLPAVLAADEVFITEGEKDALALGKLGLVATTNAQGAGKWREEYGPHFQGKQVVILSDNDEPGRAHGEAVAKHLHGVAASVKVVELPGLPAKGDASDWLAAGGTLEALRELVAVAPVWEDAQEPALPQGWELAQKILPRVPFPWEVLPASIAASLKSLARSCATSATPLPGYACCIIAAAVGRMADVQIKSSWREPLIFWHADIRESGEGKTAPAHMLKAEFDRRQMAAHERYDEQVRAHAALPRDEKAKTPDPEKPRGYFATNLTLEGVRQDLVGHHTAGLLVILEEFSALINGQNQYKSKGTDREAWLTLHGGGAARFLRQSKSIFIACSRVQVCGGIQPVTFRRCFSSEDGQYLVDGSIFRLLTVFEPAASHELTAAEWSEADAAPWHRAVSRALEWADVRQDPLVMTLTPEAAARFYDWRNELFASKADLPEQLRGFLPKAVGYAARLAGVLHLMHEFAAGREPHGVIDVPAIQRGIGASMFYLGQAVSAVQLLLGCAPATLVEVSERSRRLAVVLESLRGEANNERLAVGHVHERYNAAAPEIEKISSPHAMGGLLRSCGMKLTPGKHDANGKRGVRCLVWDGALEQFLAASQLHAPAPPPAPEPAPEPAPQAEQQDADFWEIPSEATS
ncbi:DUF3987 domain-containing protein [Megalodesulfovibrio gigas]|uniref:Toprim domain-containing protein n=1 Tax=Megalodesulfovibrio gigas (strain ATCC 19364 / DSM 1382 / NCIMB 9332 / VKM B-1759) TaxID=1121448 RepID=T2GG84_MEGG1|nr:DUF3987 domain-containing protein [Megalodesulfovibrio gigas]AGW14997.1 hypothetical protein DGI_3301 [Megalodesulfovibrio gigas DSM 1382 = ATCC 19364]